MAASTLAAFFVVAISVFALEIANGAELGSVAKYNPNSSNTDHTLEPKILSDAHCVIEHGSEFDHCNKRMAGWEDEINVKNSQFKSFCCSYVAYRNCVDHIAKQNCGDQAAKIVEQFMKTQHDKVVDDKCSSYTGVFNCMDQVVLFGIVLVVAIVLIGAISGLICVCKSCCSFK